MADPTGLKKHDDIETTLLWDTAASDASHVFSLPEDDGERELLVRWPLVPESLILLHEVVHGEVPGALYLTYTTAVRLDGYTVAPVPGTDEVSVGFTLHPLDRGEWE